MVAGEEVIVKALLSELVEEVDADQLHDVNARVLQFVTISIPVMYIGIPPFDEAVELKVELCATNDALFLSERFTSTTSFPLAGLPGENCASVAALVELAVIFASVTRIDAPAGNDPIKTRAPSLPTSDCTRIDIVGGSKEPLSAYPLLSTASTAPSSSERFVMLTITIPAARLLA